MNTVPMMSNGSANNITQRGPDSNDLRGRVVEILSGTANGCLTELGYYPGMPKKMQELEQINAQWQQENIKLFEDNRSLARALQAQSEHLKLVTGPELQRLNAIRALEHKVQALADEKSDLLKKNGALVANQPHNAEYRRLHAEYTKLSTTYGAALNEINQLRHYIQVITNTNRQYTSPTPMVQPTANSNTRQPLRQNSEPMKIPQNQVVPHPQRPQVSQPHSMSQQDGHPRTTSSVLVPGNTVHPFIHYQRLISAPSSMLPNQPSHGHHPPLSIQTSPSQRQNQYLTPTPMSAVHPSQASTSQQTSNPTVAPSPVGFTIIQSNGSLPTSPVTAIQQQWPRDATRPQITPEQMHLPLSEALTPAPVETPVNSHPNAPETSRSSLAAVTITPPTDNLSQSPNIAAMSSRSETSKRESVDMSDVRETENQQHKKQRLDEPDPLIEPAAAQDLISEANDIVEANNMDVDEESDDGVVEIGPDGFRLEEDCISALIEEDEEDETLQTCMLCKARYDMKYTPDPPQVFVRATKEELIQHCSTEHHDAWETLRRDV